MSPLRLARDAKEASGRLSQAAHVSRLCAELGRAPWAEAPGHFDHVLCVVVLRLH